MAWSRDDEIQRFIPFAGRLRRKSQSAPDPNLRPQALTTHSDSSIPRLSSRDRARPLSALPVSVGEQTERNRIRGRRFLIPSRSDKDDSNRLEEDLRPKTARPPSLREQLKTILWRPSALATLIMSPIGFALYYSHQNNIAVFFVNFFAIIPPALLLNFAVDELTMRLGDVVGCIIGFTFGNAVQLISSILLLKSRQVALLQSSLLGSMLANLLLMTGLSFFMGGVSRVEQFFHAQVAQTIGMFLLLAVLSLLVPTTAHFIAGTSPAGIQAQSRATSILIMISYALWLLFQLKTNKGLFGVDVRTREPPAKAVERRSKRLNGAAMSKSLATLGAGMAATPGLPKAPLALREEEQDDDDDSFSKLQPRLSIVGTVVTIITSTTLIGFNTEFATNSVNTMLEEAGIPESFVGLIILPLLSVDPVSIKAAMCDKMDVSLALTLERCMQTALFVTPFIVLLGWCIGVDDMTLEFSAFSVATLFASIFIVTYVIQEGKSNWLTGILLIKVYIIIAISSFYVPRKATGEPQSCHLTPFRQRLRVKNHVCRDSE